MERYAEQRLIMFKAYRQRDRLKNGHDTWYGALCSWLDEAGTNDKFANAARHERDVYLFRQQLLADAELAGKEVETPEHSEDEDEDKDGDDDPLVALSQMYPQASLNLEVQKALAEDFDWTHHDRPLDPLFDSELPWLSAMRDKLGDSTTPDYSKYDPEQLVQYPEQHFAYRLITSKARALINGIDSTPLLMIIDGPGGVGKSTVLHCCVRTILELAAAAKYKGTPVRVCAPTGSAASGIFGCTLHSFIRFNPSRFFAELQGKAETEWQEFIKGLLFIFIDERSLMSQQILVYLLARLRQGIPDSTHPTGGVSIILLGDDFQLPPMNGGRLSDEPYSTYLRQRKYSEARALARKVYIEHFQTCVQLTTNVRAAGSSPS